MSFDNRPIDVGIRIGSLFLDLLLMGFVALIFTIPDFIISNTNPFDATYVSGSGYGTDYYFSYISIIGLAVYIAKDSLQGRSLAKRILKQQVVNDITGEVASPLRCLIRNLPLVIWPIEALAALIDPERRLGDRLAGTRLVRFNPEQNHTPINKESVLGSFLLAYLVIVWIWTSVMAPLNLPSK